MLTLSIYAGSPEKINLTPERLAEKLKVTKEMIERRESGESKFLI